jgi:hypothetical protein
LAVPCRPAGRAGTDLASAEDRRENSRRDALTHLFDLRVDSLDCVRDLTVDPQDDRRNARLRRRQNMRQHEHGA